MSHAAMQPPSDVPGDPELVAGLTVPMVDFVTLERVLCDCEALCVCNWWEKWIRG